MAINAKAGAGARRAAARATSDAAAGEALSATSDAARGVKPFDTYFGSKDAAGVVEWFLSLMPPHAVYIEAFLGGGALLRHKVPALRTIGIDADARVITAWQRADWPGVELIKCDALKWLASSELTLSADTLVYCDPPYLRSTRRSRKRYRVEFDARAHASLLALLEQLPCSVMLSGYDSPLYRRVLADWEHHTRPAMTRGGPAIEHLWIRRSRNAGPGVAAGVTGKDFRERWRITKRVRRWCAKFAAMPDHERAAVLAALLREHGRGSALPRDIRDRLDAALSARRSTRAR